MKDEYFLIRKKDALINGYQLVLVTGNLVDAGMLKLYSESASNTTAHFASKIASHILNSFEQIGVKKHKEPSGESTTDFFKSNIRL